MHYSNVAIAFLVLSLSEACRWQYSTEYNELCAKHALVYSFAAYTQEISELYEWRCKNCIDAVPLHIIGLLDGDTEDHYGFAGYPISTPDVLIISFRGSTSSSIDTGIADLDFFPTPWPEGVPDSRVRHGFFRYYIKVRDRVRQIVTKWLLHYPNSRVVITGHSLGAAAATIAAVDLIDLVPKPIVYTFGGPRIGNGYLAQHIIDMGLMMFRIIHDHDIIPQAPMCELPWPDGLCPGGWNPTHPPIQILYNQNMTEYRECSREDGEDPACSNSFPVLSLSLEDHFLYFGYNLH